MRTQSAEGSSSALFIRLGSEPVQGCGKFNIGLVRYNSDGVQMGWQGASMAYAPDPRYLIYPNASTGEFAEIWDMKLYRDTVFVLAFDGTYARVVQFTTDGGYAGDLNVGQIYAVGNPYLERGGGMLFYQNGGGVYKMVVAMNGGGFSIRMRGYKFDGHTLMEDPDFGTFDSSNSTYVTLYDKNICDGIVGYSDCEQLAVTGVATWFGDGTDMDGTVPIMYVTGSYQASVSGADAEAVDVFLAKVHADTGDLYTAFGTDTTTPDSDDGVIRLEFDNGSGNEPDLARSIATRLGICFIFNGNVFCGHNVFLAVSDDAECAANNIGDDNWMTIASVSSGGGPNTLFSSDGWGRWGAECTGATNPEDAVSTNVWDMATVGSGLALVGERTAWDSSAGSFGEYRTVPYTAIVDTGGEIEDDRSHSYDTSNIDSDEPVGWFRALTADGVGGYFVTGTSDQLPAVNKNSDILVAHMRSDRIFGSGFNSLFQ